MIPGKETNVPRGSPIRISMVPFGKVTLKGCRHGARAGARAEARAPSRRLHLLPRPCARGRAVRARLARPEPGPPRERRARHAACTARQLRKQPGPHAARRVPRCSLRSLRSLRPITRELSAAGRFPLAGTRACRSRHLPDRSHVVIRARSLQKAFGKPGSGLALAVGRDAAPRSARATTAWHCGRRITADPERPRARPRRARQR
jgi:hypothetical protein